MDKLWSIAVRSRDGQCLICGKKETLAAAHIFSRVSRSVRWDLDNGIGLCYRHHIHFAHSEPVLFTRWLEETKGKEFVLHLTRKKNRIKQWTLEQMELQIFALEEYLKNYANTKQS